MILRRWQVIIVRANGQQDVVERCFTEEGARRARGYWWRLMHYVGSDKDGSHPEVVKL